MGRRKILKEENKEANKMNEEKEELIELNTTEETQEVKEELENPNVGENSTGTQEDNKIVGKVTGTELLNVRKEPNTQSDVLLVIKSDKEVEIIDESNKDFYKVLVDNKEGYCMKQFITKYGVKLI